ncbi:MAG: prepilin-type N-terminal cleavage/methylation domain-containing protein [Gemmataceae bacterium]|nr:prepilin-type N-terminal cleavage/methylation domain-containing protein [Gemmataceae bacterium]MCS7271345.1 prepilin-type N-terminal cleavage/methylation domain-containing protein [Gemmataceae bacterium]MDW8243452.1 prepilin-type N-terminal cleavage/methylation domain-containing protein [Thermogemmata sp.]
MRAYRGNTPHGRVYPKACVPAQRPGARRYGLSLIEVLLALAIFLTALVAIARLVDMGADLELEARYQSRGARLAQAKLAEVECGIVPLESGSGTFDGDDANWNWTLTVQSADIPNLYLVSVSVSREVKGQTVTVTLSQYILDPTLWGTAGEATRPDPSSNGTTGGGS